MLEKASYQFGLIGLGVMGRNFILNVADKGFTALGYDLDEAKVRALQEEGGDLSRVNATKDLAAFVQGLQTPRKIMLLVPAGKPVDAVIEALLPHAEAGDLIIDGGTCGSGMTTVINLAGGGAELIRAGKGPLEPFGLGGD